MSAVSWQLLKWLGPAVAALGAALAGLLLWDERARRQAAARAQGRAPRRGPWSAELRAWAEEGAARRLPPGWQAALGRWLASQGREQGGAAALAVRSAGLGLLGLSLGLAAGLGAYAPLGALLGALPALRLRDQAQLRRRQLARALPEALDLLSACVQAGLGLDPALQRVAGQLPPGPLRDELRRCLDELRLGRPRREAFAALEARAGVAELGGMLRAILRSEARGVPLAPVLLGLSRQLRRLRSLRVQKQAAEAPVKMLLPLMGFILPVVFLVLFGPIILKLTDPGL